MSKWELWSGTAEDGTVSDAYFQADNDLARKLAIGEGLNPIWSTLARSHNDAHRALHAHMGWEEYMPMLRADGTPHPEDEADQHEAT